MTEGLQADVDLGAVDPPTAVRTGVPLVDAILESVEAAAGLPLSDQVGVYERAHDQLRRALDAPADAAIAASEDN